MIDSIQDIYRKDTKDAILSYCRLIGTFTFSDISNLFYWKFGLNREETEKVLEFLEAENYIESLKENGFFAITNSGKRYIEDKYHFYRAKYTEGKYTGDIRYKHIFEDDFEEILSEKFVEINNMLIDKNKRYGNSSLEPFGLFPDLSRESKIEARIEDKLKRIQNIQQNMDSTLSLINMLSKNDKTSKDYKDALRDLTGYLILYQIALEE